MPKKVAKLGLTKLPFAYCKNANSCKLKGQNQAEFIFFSALFFPAITHIS